MSQKPKFDPSRVASLLENGAKEGGGPLSERPAPILKTVPSEPAAAPAEGGSTTSAEPPAARATEASSPKRPITVRISEEVFHAVLGRQAEMRSQPGMRLSDTTIGEVIDTLLRGPLGLA
jgi:hypothetical protein